MQNPSSLPPVAIVGIGGIFPDALHIDEFWQNIEAGHSAAREVPEGRWTLPLDAVYAEQRGPDTVYSKHGCYVPDIQVAPEGLNLDPEVARALDPVHHVALHAAKAAIEDANLAGRDLSRAGVYIGNIALPTETTSALTAEILGRLFEERLNIARPHSHSGTHPLNRYAFGLVAGIVAQAFGCGGGSYALDAACASSLYAVKFAVDELQAGRADMMLSGGVSRPDSLYTQMGFCQLKALSPTGVCAPFDANRDGLVVGEGAGIVVLKRLDDALRDDDHIYAVIRGIGLSNDRRGALLAPDSQGQVRAMRAAYEQAGWTPDMVDLIECHGTGTPAGDVVEFTSLRDLWGADGWQRGQCVLGSVKSNVGHLLTGAGAAGLIKALLALKHATLPPIANFETPGPKIPLSHSPFRVLRSAEAWDRRNSDTPRRAAVSAFGFGGINGHVLLEEWPMQVSDTCADRQSALKRALTSVRNDSVADPVAVVGMGAHVGPWKSLRAFQERVLGNAAPVEPARKTSWWGIEDSDLLKELDIEPGRLKGYYLETLEVPFGKFRIPPKELQETLPQQILMLLVVAEALDNVRSSANLSNDQLQALRLRSGVFVGTGLDLNTTNFSYRWLIGEKAAQWAAELGLHLSEDALRQWTAALRDSFSPPLTANRTVGALGGIVASRIAREFHVGGPSFALSSEESSGLRALEVAARALRQRDIDQAIVGAVDLGGDLRALLATHALRPFSATGETLPFAPDADGSVPGEGAAAVILKRLSDAERDGDRIYALIQGIGSASAASGAEAATSAYTQALRKACADGGTAPETISYIETHGSAVPAEDTVEAAALRDFFGSREHGRLHGIGSVKADIGHTGATAGLAGFVKTCLCLYHNILPSVRTIAKPESSVLGDAPFYLPAGPQYWLRNRADGPRRAGVSSSSIDGNYLHVVVEEYERPDETAWEAEHLQPTGPRDEALLTIEADDHGHLVEQLQALRQFAANHHALPIEALARAWWQRQPAHNQSALAAAFVARTAAELLEQTAAFQQTLTRGHEQAMPGNRIFYAPAPLGKTGDVAFVYPGSGDHYPGMGRGISAQWPEILRRQDRDNRFLRRQYVPDLLWNGASSEAINRHPRELILGQVAYGTLMTDLLHSFDIRPQAVIGYSLGESAGFFALRAWTERDEMLRRILASPLFTNDLAGADLAARKAWNLRDDETVDWVIAALQCPAEQVRQALKGRKRVYLLIINTPDTCVIGGNRQAVNATIAALGCRSHPLYGVSTAHCEVLRQVAEPYRQLHWFDSTQAPDGVRFYSGAWGRAYDVTPDTAAEAILAQASSTIDYPATIAQAYRDGVRVFVEIGPGTTCSRMIRDILADRPHFARSACHADSESVSTILRLLGALIAERVPVNLAKLYARRDELPALSGKAETVRALEIPIGRGAFSMPPMPDIAPEAPQTPQFAPSKIAQPTPVEQQAPPVEQQATISSKSIPASTPEKSRQIPPERLPEHSRPAPQKQPTTADAAAGAHHAAAAQAPLAQVVAGLAAASAETSTAHAAYLHYSQGITDSFTRQAAFQMTLLEAARQRGEPLALDIQHPVSNIPTAQTVPSRTRPKAETTPEAPPRDSAAPVLMNRAQCLEFAVGSIAAVLGDRYRDVDGHPTRVRLPDEPLMLVDRILSVEGEPCSMSHGTVVTEHDILPGDWYLDCGRIPTCIAVESGQADLFLSGYLGIDLQTKGLAVYRLLDAIVTFHDDLPGPGKVIRYVINIDGFFRQGETYLFHFNFESTVDGKPFLSMREGCAGFFTQPELDAGQGIVLTSMDRKPLAGTLPDEWQPLTAMRAEAYSDEQIDALRRGDLVGCFGEPFAGLALQQPSRLPGGRLHLIDRVLHLDPQGGRYGLGQIQAEADIHPDDWFLTCHFVDDQVMPGTLMYECSLHAFRVLLMRMGWVGEQDAITWEPVPEIPGQLKCRGQVIATTHKVMYEVSLKEIGFRPEPYAVADALMYADGKPIVRMLNMSLRMSGTTREELERLWHARRSATPAAQSPQYDRKPAIFDSDSILAFAVGNPSEAFGERYAAFDHDRVIARLPGPPYKFLDRITAIQGEQWVMTAGKIAEAQYDIPVNEWYFEAESPQAAPDQQNMPKQRRMPFAVLLEVALQPCGWLAAYAGSALTSDTDLSFRNLGGQATQFLPVTPQTGTLTTTVKLTNVSQSGGMIIQHYDMDMRNSAGQPVYQGTTYFGFFSKTALANQVGLRESQPYQPSPDECARGEQFAYPQGEPFPGPQLRMLDEVALFVPDGGPHGLGFLRGVKRIVPDEWFFQAHFYQDPVWPGSLGLEAFLQLLKFAAVKRWGWQPGSHFESMALNAPHQWVYRGQVIPQDHDVTVEAVITGRDDTQRRLEAQGFLIVDGRIIYQMEHFTLAAHV